MLHSLQNIYHLGIKELFSLRRDVVMLILMLYTFTLAIYIPAQHAQTELRNAAVAVVDEDASQLSQRIRDALLAVILSGAALIREREHGTIEHLLVMPLRQVEIMSAKVCANGLVIVIAATLSLIFVVGGVLDVPVAGSIPLFVVGTTAYLFSVTALGIFLATLARSMPQFGLLATPVTMVMMLLSGSTTPLDSMPTLMQYVMHLAPSTHFVSFAQGVLYRGAGFDTVWPDFALIAALGAVFFVSALLRFRKTVSLAE